MMKHLRLSLQALFMLSIFLFGSMNSNAQNRFETRINESAGDVEEHGPTSLTPGTIYFISAVNLVTDTMGAKHRGVQTVGLRFTDIGIPQNALILNAYIQFDSWSATTDSTSVSISTEDVEDAQPIVGTDFNISTRAKTADPVPWIDIPAWTSGGLHGPDQQTPELASIVQPVVDKAGWMTGNSLCFIIEGYGNRVATSWDNNPDLAPLLVVDFGAKIEETACDSYSSPSGKTWTSSGTYWDTIPNSVGGDSIIRVDLTVLESTTSTVVETVCDSYTSPSGKIWTTSGTYMDTIPNAAGCDSVITVELTVNNSTSATLTETACDRYTSPSGKVWTTSGTYMDTIPNAAGCDSVLTINLTVNNSSSSTINETVCDSYTSPSGKVWTVSGTYMDTIPNAAGCDSVITVELTVDNSTSSILTELACESYTSPSGKIWTVSGTYMDTIPNAAGCDSVITIELTVDQDYTGEINDTICHGESYSFGGMEITESGQYSDTLLRSSGCDSIVVLNLVVHTIDTSVAVSGNVLTANETDAQYQWMKDDTLIDGATSQAYTATETGSYAVIVTKGNCVDTSGVYNITISTGVLDLSFGSEFTVYPNPTRGDITVDLGMVYETVYLRLYSISGKLVSMKEYSSQRKIDYQISGDKGIYFLQITSDKGEQARIKVMKE